MEFLDWSVLNKRLVWITIINHGYINYTKNFLKSMEKANIQFKLIVFCTDKLAFDALQGNDRCICLMADFIPNPVSADMKKWDDIDYKRIVFTKIDAIAYALKSTYDLGVESIGYIDTDIFLFSDPTVVMLNEMDQYKNINIFCQCDENKHRCTNPFACPSFCSGVLVIRNKKELHQYFTYTDNNIRELSGDQMLLLLTFTKEGVAYKTIDKTIMPNGCYYQIRVDKIQPGPSVCLLHFNWIIGNDKENVMKYQNMWLI